MTQIPVQTTKELIGYFPGMWNVYARFAVRTADAAVKIPAGKVLTLVEKRPRAEDGSEVYIYRLVDGLFIAIDHQLTEAEAQPVKDTELLQAVLAYKSLSDWMSESGLELARVYEPVPPFSVIRCPLCGGHEFTSVDFAAVYCNTCNAHFSVRHTAGDPGFVVDCELAWYSWWNAKYVIPPALTLSFYMVLKDTDDPRNMDTENCGCGDHPALTGEDERTLRPGLHKCNIGTVYEWRLAGTVPTRNDLKGNTTANIEGEIWPQCATVEYFSPGYELRSALESLLFNFKQNEKNPAVIDAATAPVKELLERPNRPVSGMVDSLPDAERLADGEVYLLHHWLIADDKTALPVWWVVRPKVDNGYFAGFDVVRKNICPVCQSEVTTEEFNELQYSSRPEKKTNCEHRWCAETWLKYNWALPQEEK